MQQYSTIFQTLECPFAWLDYNALDQNIDFVKQQCGTKSIRIATKSIRSVEILRYLQQQLDKQCGFMTFTAAETVYLLQQGFDNLLLGYPVVERQAIVALAHYVKQQKNITFMVDSREHLQLLAQIADEVQTQLSICIDINVSTDFKVLYFGTKRSPITSLLKLKQFVTDIDMFPQLTVVGCMAYDAQIAGVTDNTTEMFGLKSSLIRQLKKQSLTKISTFRQLAVEFLQQHYTLQFVNAGGTGSMSLMQQEPDVTEITVGSAFFAPALFQHYTALTLAPAVGFALRVTRKFAPNMIVCHGGGYLASGTADKSRYPVFLEPQHYRFLATEGAGEVQTPIVVTGRQHHIGDVIYLQHAKAGELGERFALLHTTKDGHYTGSITTYRGDQQCFL